MRHAYDMKNNDLACLFLDSHVQMMVLSETKRLVPAFRRIFVILRSVIDVSLSSTICGTEKPAKALFDHFNNYSWHPGASPKWETGL